MSVMNSSVCGNKNNRLKAIHEYAVPTLRSGKMLIGLTNNIKNTEPWKQDYWIRSGMIICSFK